MKGDGGKGKRERWKVPGKTGSEMQRFTSAKRVK
jgi:hypothetical protein